MSSASATHLLLFSTYQSIAHECAGGLQPAGSGLDVEHAPGGVDELEELQYFDVDPRTERLSLKELEAAAAVAASDAPIQWDPSDSSEVSLQRDFLAPTDSVALLLQARAALSGAPGAGPGTSDVGSGHSTESIGSGFRDWEEAWEDNLTGLLWSSQGASPVGAHRPGGSLRGPGVELIAEASQRTQPAQVVDTSVVGRREPLASPTDDQRPIESIRQGKAAENGTGVGLDRFAALGDTGGLGVVSPWVRPNTPLPAGSVGHVLAVEGSRVFEQAIQGLRPQQALDVIKVGLGVGVALAHGTQSEPFFSFRLLLCSRLLREAAQTVTEGCWEWCTCPDTVSTLWMG